jgi:flagellar motor switch protein FliN/FliY
MATRTSTKALAKKAATPQEHLPSPVADSPASLADVEVEFSIELGRCRLSLDQALNLGENSMIELDKMLGEPVEIRLNGRLFARGEVVTVSENFGVRLLEIIRE